MNARVARLTPNGEIHTADLIASIAKRLSEIAGNPHYRSGGMRCLVLLQYSEQLRKLAKALDGNP